MFFILQTFNSLDSILIDPFDTNFETTLKESHRNKPLSGETSTFGNGIWLSMFFLVIDQNNWCMCFAIKLACVSEI